MTEILANGGIDLGGCTLMLSHLSPSTRQFYALIEPRIVAARALIERTMNLANLTASQIDHVIRVGGSSRIPAFTTMLEGIFPSRVCEGEVFTSIASGLLFANS